LRTIPFSKGHHAHGKGDRTLSNSSIGKTDPTKKRPDGAHPNSVQGKADPATLRQIRIARAKARADEKAMSLWARDGFVSAGGFADGMHESEVLNSTDVVREDEDE